MSKNKEQVFDISLFKRLLIYIKPYKLIFFSVLIAVILIALSGAIRPKILQLAIDENIATKTVAGFLPDCHAYFGGGFSIAFYFLLRVVRTKCG